MLVNRAPNDSKSLRINQATMAERSSSQPRRAARRGPVVKSGHLKTPPLLQHLKYILRQYPDGGQIIKVRHDSDCHTVMGPLLLHTGRAHTVPRRLIMINIRKGWGAGGGGGVFSTSTASHIKYMYIGRTQRQLYVFMALATPSFTAKSFGRSSGVKST